MAEKVGTEIEKTMDKSAQKPPGIFKQYWWKLTQLIVFFGGLILAVISAIAAPFQCELILQKAPCWDQHRVSLKIIDNANPKSFETIEIEQAERLKKQMIKCRAGQGLILRAKYAPVLWAEDQNQWFKGGRMWLVPHRLMPGHSRWDMKVCYPTDFQNTPIPIMNAGVSCECEVLKNENNQENDENG